MITAAIMQPSYLGWLGYFDMLDQADVFVLLDNVQVEQKSWQTRNRILARTGEPLWLSIPIHTTLTTQLCDVRIANEHRWRRKHIGALTACYRPAPHWDYLDTTLAFIETPWKMLGDLTAFLIELIAQELGIRTRIVRSSQFKNLSTSPVQRIADICLTLGADEFLNTPGSKVWLEGKDIGVPIRWHEYEHPTYTQGTTPFVSHLSVVDLLAWHGPNALSIIRSGRR